MTNEKRLDLIDRGALGIGYANPSAFDKIEYAQGWNSAINIINNAPTVDAVEVVRCKDCHWWRKINRTGSGLCRHTVFSIDDCTADPTTNSDDFCSYGEKH